MYNFAFQTSLVAGMFPSLLFIFVELGCGRLISCGFDAFLVEWIPFTDFNKQYSPFARVHRHGAKVQQWSPR